MSERYEIAARVIKARGLEGKVVAASADGLPLAVYEGLEVWVIPPALWEPRTFTVKTVENERDESCLISFEEAKTIDDVEFLAGRYLLARAEDLDVFDDEIPVEIIGRRVVDAALGELGEVAEILESPAHPILVVNGERGEVLIPFVEDFIDALADDGAYEALIASDDAPITTHVPEGLVGA